MGMGMEFREPSAEKKPDSVLTIYSNDISHDLDHGVVSSNHACEEPQEDKDTASGSSALRQMCEVDECIIDSSPDTSQPSEDGTSADEKPVNTQTECLQQEKVKAKTYKSASSPKSGSKPTSPKCTVPRPFTLATKMRASCLSRNLGIETPTKPVVSQVSAKSKKSDPSSYVNKNQLASLFMSSKALEPEDEDTQSSASSIAASVRPSKAKPTIASAPVFRSTKRAEKRKEYFTKLEEKHQVLEAEKLQNEERTKEEREAAIKQLRKSMVFKASPMPSFYHDGPHPMPEASKPTPTRAESPKLGRRKSSGDAVRVSQVKNRIRSSDMTIRHSLDTCGVDSIVTDHIAVSMDHMCIKGGTNTFELIQS